MQTCSLVESRIYKVNNHNYMCMSKGGWGGCTVSMVAKILVIIGGINWGLVGLGMLMAQDLNVVHMVFVSMPMVEAIVYLLVGVAAVAKIFGCKCGKCMAMCAACEGSGKTGGNMQ